MHEGYDAQTEVRAERYRAMVEELMPKIRRVSPHMNDAELRAAAERMAQYRLADEELGKQAL